MANPVSSPTMNGLDSGPTTAGFRHHLPQIATMARNPKIAQSKMATKTEVGTTVEQSTMEVEGVGSVVHIGSDITEADDTPEKKLLENFENTVASTTDVEKMDTSGEKMETAKTEVETSDGEAALTVANTEKELPANDKLAVNDQESNSTELTKLKSKPEVQSPTVQSPTLQSPTTESRRRSRKSIEKKDPAVTAETPSAVEAKSPTKRQRKPKKFDLEEEVQSPKTPKTVKTPKDKPVKQATELSPDEESKLPVTWQVGDLVWSKVSGHPWWPCMISYDPYIAQHTRIHRKARDYHVQFFGNAAERAWISTNNLLEFKGRAHFEEFVKDIYSKAKNKGELKKVKAWYGVAPHKAAAVNIGIDQAETALPMSKNERKSAFTFVYQLPPKDKKSSPSKLSDLEEDVKIIQNAAKGTPSETEHSVKKSKKRKHSDIGSPTPGKQSNKKQKTNAETPKSKASPIKPAGKKTPVHRPSAGMEASFDVFCQKERDTVLADHPDFSDEMLLDYCRQQWCMMSQKQKSRYKSKYSETEASSKLSPSRQRKPSKKLIEAEEGNKALDEELGINKTRVTDQAPSVASPVTEPAKRPGRGRKSAGGVKQVVAEVTPDTASEKKTDSIKKKGRQRKSEVAATAAPTEMDDSSSRTAETVETVTSGPVKNDPIKKKGRPKKSDVPEVAEKENTNSSTAESVDSTVLIKNDPIKKKGRSKKSDAPDTAEKDDTNNTTAESVDTIVPVKPSSLIPAKRVRSRKSTSVDTDSQQEQMSDRSSTPSPTTVYRTPVRREKEEFQYEMELYKLSSAGPLKKENLCQICDETGDLLECEGPCQGFFHTDCLGLSTTPSGPFKCDECMNGIHSCFVCKKCDAGTQRCSVAVCGKYYHVDCLKQFPQTKIESKGLTCPLHHCHSCFANNLKTSGRLLRCVRCPTAYHVGDYCVAGGSINLAGYNMLCAKHFQPNPSTKHHTHVNVSWCFDCNKGGTLLCCETCPAAFHASCLKIDFPTGSWYCPDCEKGKRPLYGEIIWVKLGNYRWWPGEICHPRNVPLNIQEKPHQVGEFPVHFLGSHDYFWLHQGRVFSFQDGDKGNAASMVSKELGKQFMKGLREASEAYKVWKEFRDNKEQLELEREQKKPAPFKMVKTNVPLGSVTIKKADLAELPKCECKADQENACSMTSDCLNYMMMYECHPALCQAGEKCHNQFFTKRQYPAQKQQRADGRGWGLIAMEDIKKSQFVNEYVGDLIDEVECKRRIEKAHENNIHNFYMMTLDMDRIIDAGPKGNLSRFMNHSCDPNLETQKWNVNGDVRVGLFALRDIKQGEELTFNYNFDCLGNEQTKCSCGSKNCSGYLGVRPKSTVVVDNKKKEAKTSKVKKKKKVKRKHEDDCFRCGEGGELVMCDRGSCPKSYHLRCLGLNKFPYGKWDCPWHHCDECGKPAVRLCVECPNSFCTTHSETNVKTFDNKTYCTDHDDLLDTLTESQSHTSVTSDEISDCPSDMDNKDKPGKVTDVPADKTDTEVQPAETGTEKKDINSSKIKEKLPPKKRNSKSSSTEFNGKSGNGTNGKKGKKTTPKGSAPGKGPLPEEALAVAPMFDDSEEEEFNLVIDIPNF